MTHTEKATDLGKDFSKPDELAAIRREGLVKKVCPHVLQASIEIIEDILRRQDEDGGYGLTPPTARRQRRYRLS